MSRPKSLYYPDPNDVCFRKHFKKLVAQHGGEWVVIAGGEIVAIGPEERVAEMRQKAKALYPDDTPLVTPVPAPEDIECILSSSPTMMTRLVSPQFCARSQDFARARKIQSLWHKELRDILRTRAKFRAGEVARPRRP